MKIKNQPQQKEIDNNNENSSFLKFSITPKIKNKFKFDQNQSLKVEKRHNQSISKMDEKYIKESSEIENLKMMKDSEKMKKKILEIQKIRNLNENQILLKKKRAEEEKIKDKNYQIKILEDVENFKKNYEVEERKVREINRKYQNELLKQIYERKTKLECSV